MSAFLLRKNIFTKGKGEQMKAFLILEDGTVFTGTSIGSTRDMISEIVFNTSMTGYLEVLTDPSYAGQAVVMTYPLIGNYGITPDMESLKAWPDGYIVRKFLQNHPLDFGIGFDIHTLVVRNLGCIHRIDLVVGNTRNHRSQIRFD